MKTTLLASLALLLVGGSTYGQGTILFNNRTGPIDAPFGTWEGRGLGDYGATAQLFLIQGNTFTPLSPSTTFRDTSPAARYYVNQVTVTVPGIPAGSQATVLMRAWVGPDYENASFFGQSNPVTITLGGLPPGGGAPLPDGLLIGLSGITTFPEPSTKALMMLGVAALLWWPRKRTSRA